MNVKENYIIENKSKTEIKNSRLNFIKLKKKSNGNLISLDKGLINN